MKEFRNDIKESVLPDIIYNCTVSDARDHGIYSMCSLVLKLRNLYKWEQGLEPWEEPESAELLDWIEEKENHWASMASESFRVLDVDRGGVDPYDTLRINRYFHDAEIFYGAGYGRSLKTVFFLADVRERREVRGCPVVVLGRELAKELESPFAFVQDGGIVIRRESLRSFLWDHIQELRSSCRTSITYLLDCYNLRTTGNLDQALFRESLDKLVDNEMNVFILHEVGEMLEESLDSETLKALVGRFSGSVIEFVCRALKDVLADTHPQGLLAHLVEERIDSSLSLYVGFLDGLRERLFPEMAKAWKDFTIHGDWETIESARQKCRRRNKELADEVRDISRLMEHNSDQQVLIRFTEKVLKPLDLDVPVEAT